MTEYVNGGNLRDYLMEYKPAVPVLIRLAKETASGMHYLSSQSQPLVHRDLASNLYFPASTLMNDQLGTYWLTKKDRTLVWYVQLILKLKC